MDIKFYKWVGDSVESVTADIDFDQISRVCLINYVIRRKDGYIRRFSKSISVSFKPPYTVDGCSTILGICKSYLPVFKAYMKSVGGFKVSKSYVLELKKTRWGMAERKAVDWLWTREIRGV
jgi:hypothetical protein